MRSPSRVSASSVFSPTPHSALTGSGCRNSTTRSTGTTMSPSGLARDEASFATNLVPATPTEQVTPCSSWIRARMCSAIVVGEPSRRTVPATSRKASSSDSGSTSGVTERKTAMTLSETWVYSRWSGRRTTACGHSRRARVIGIAECTPKRRAS